MLERYREGKKIDESERSVVRGYDACVYSVDNRLEGFEGWYVVDGREKVGKD